MDEGDGKEKYKKKKDMKDKEDEKAIHIYNIHFKPHKPNEKKSHNV